MPRVPTYHSEDWLRQLARGQAGAAFFRWWFDGNVAPLLSGRGALFHTGFDPADVVPVEEKEFLSEGGNLPDFCLVRLQQLPAEQGNVIASFSVNLQAAPYTMHSGAMTAGCYRCPAQTPCFEKESQRLWVNVYHQQDSIRWEERVQAPDFRVAVLLRSSNKFRTAIESGGLHDSLLNYLRGGLPNVSVPEHAELFRRLDEIGYIRGRHQPQIVWLRSDDPVFSEESAGHWVTKVKTQASPRRVHCVALDHASPGNDLAALVAQLVENAFPP